ncbi:cohesin complex subunit [Malassezia brasiliensis]|uniref:Cohesin complex subunit n=1 Tax=Malassezia brasiliensis TaxID=1821822 RepID=A0AAF0DVD2_9BASI|nr:cohesin complex subunit [Malassezia brasiliensis]
MTATRARRAPKARSASNKRARTPESESELSSVPSEDEAPPAKRVAPRVDVVDMDDSELFHAVLAPDTIDAAAENWVVAFQDEPEEALAQLVTFLLRLCGCDARVEAQAAADADALSDALARVEDAWAPHATGAYPLVSRARPLRHARKHAARLVAQLLNDAADAEVLGDATLLGALQTALGTLSQSPLRAFRHTATLVTLWVLEGLAAQLDATRDAYLVAERQRAAEAHRTGANRTRAAHSAQRMEHLDTLRDTLDTNLDALVRDVWTQRVCDVDAHIRAACIEQLGALLQRHPVPFVQDAYLRPLGAALGDPDGGVRLHALRAAQHVCVPAHDVEAHAFVTAHAKRLRDMALYDVELRVRVAAFALLAAANALGALARDDAGALAVHLFDADAQIRVAAAGLVATLVGDAPTTAATAAPLVRLVAQYDAQLSEHTRGADDDHDDHDNLDSELLVAGEGRVGVAAEALWDASAAMQVWRPYLDLVLDGAERPAHEEAVALELLVAGVRLTRARNVETDGVPAIEACSDELATALPRLLAHFSGDAARLADVLRIVPHLDLGVYAEPRHTRALDTLWDDVSAHLVRHTAPHLLHAAAQALERLAAAPAAVSTRAAKLAALYDAVVGTLTAALDGRAIDTAVFTDDDVHAIHAALARLHALLRALDAGALIDDAALFDTLLGLARRGRLAHAAEQPFVARALDVLTLYIVWRTHAAPTEAETLISRRTELLATLDPLVRAHGPLCRTAVHCTLLLYTLYASLPDEAAELRLACPAHAQQACAAAVEAELEADAARFRAAQAQVPRRGAPPPPVPATARTALRACALASALVTAVQVGALEVSHSVAVLRFYAHFSADYDSLCQTLVHVLRDDALHAGRAWAVCATILDALRQSCAAYLRDGDERTEAHFVALARQLANATLLRGPGFAVAHAIDADAMRTLHVAGAQQVLAWHAAPPHEGHVATFFRGLAAFLGTVSPGGAMQIHAALQQRFAAAHVDPSADARAWDAYFAYEKRLLNLAARDAHLVQEAQHYNTS